MIKIISDPDTQIWEQFVYDHPQGNIFQTPDISTVYKNTKHYTPVTLAAVDTDTNDMVALLNAVIIKEFNGFFERFTARSIIIGGPLFLDNDMGKTAVKKMMEYYDSTFGQLVIYTEARNVWDIKEQITFPGYEYEDHLNYLIDLTSGEQEIWKNLSKARKYGIKKSKKMGVEIHEMNTRDELPVLYNLLTDTYKKARHPLADISLFISLFSVLVPKNRAKIFFAKCEENYIGAIILLMYENKLYDWYSCSKTEYSNYYPNDRLVWHALEWGSANHYSVFDFMGAGKPHDKYGVREFKKQFGGTLVNFGRLKKIHSPITMWVIQKGFPLYRHFLR
jgi:lipid II:glycine glycyltransferase (peptidoglycan interpeptide bridge formation enzyme)